ncbi:hypothetical protein AL755_08320 [Arthrobacter sp. ERGS1:01]|nr:hypothetical protein AL755_08320 [Arthrobacter sp. ERGS1:01]
MHAPLSTAGTWQRWLLGSALAGIGWGVVWWLAAPGGAFYGNGTDYAVWLPRDLMLGAISVLAGFAMGVLLVRAADRPGGRAGAVTRLLAATVGGLLGSVIAWRIGVFAGDLFHTPPANMPNPSIVFSLRSSSILLLWPLAAAAVVFVHTFVSYAFVPSRSAD